MNAGAARERKTLGRYLAFQTVGWVAAVLAALAAVRFDLVGPRLATVVVLAWVAKDLALYRFVRHAYETGAPSPSERLVGAVAVVERDLGPRGLVRLGHELWTARVDGDCVIEAGARVRVVAVEGLALLVERDTA